jgi:anti-anti-sigma regulatory factor
LAIISENGREENHPLAKNFEIGLKGDADPVVLDLEGDFDATSAYELIYAIKKLPGETAGVSIHTNGLKSICPAGIDVFCRLMQDLNYRPRKIALTGHHATRLWPENLHVASIPQRVTSWW